MDYKTSEELWRPKVGVINTEMITNAIKKMIQDEVPGVKFDEQEGFELHEVTMLYLEHLDILRIDHLWIMPALRVLKLTGNLISKIENLETLVNLVDLNLSFNRISKIENLDKLVNLRHLSLFSNLITKLENLDHLKELKIFTIGENEIETKDCILHLRNMNLFSLNMVDNPCSQKDGFWEYVAAYMPNLEYYDYKKVTKKEKEAGREAHILDLEILEREEAKQSKEAQLAKELADKKESYSMAFVEDLDGDQLFDLMMDSDPSGQAFLLIGDEVVDIFDKFKKYIGNATTEIFNRGLDQLKLRQKEIEMFRQSSEDAVVKSRGKQRELLERFLENKSLMMVELTGLWGSQEGGSEGGGSFRRSLDQAVDKASGLCIAVKKELLTLELTLSEQLKEVFSLFERSLGDMINSFIESAQGFFTEMREHETVLGEQLSDHANRFFTQLHVRNEDVCSLPPALRPLMADKEVVNAALASSHDVYLQVIDNREDRLMNRARNWYQKLCYDTEQEETDRFRGRIKEIVHFLELQSKEFQQYQVVIDEDIYVLSEGN